MSLGGRLWTPRAVLALQDAYRVAYPDMTDEEFAQDVLGIAPRTLYLWKSRPDTRLRRATSHVLDQTLARAPAQVAARFDLLDDSAALVDQPGLDTTIYTAELAAALEALGDLAAPHVASPVYRPDNLAATILDWITSVPDNGNRGNAPVGAEDVAQIRATIAALDLIERHVGGNGCRESATKYLRDHALPMLHRSITVNQRTELFAVVAELCELVGWMHYDAGQHGRAQSYFTQALRLAREANDGALAAYLMTSITHQALHLGETTVGLRVANAARSVAESADSRNVLVEAELLVARAHATLGHAADATSALTRAETTYERGGEASGRAWEPQWDDVMFASHAGTCWNDLGNTKEARRLLTFVWDESGERPRRRIYSAAELGLAAAREGELELACQHAADVFTLDVSVESNRTRQHIDRLAAALRPFASSRPVSDLFTAHGIDPSLKGASPR